MTIARRFIVRGRVQGVGYRYFAIRAAAGCNLTGYVKNLADGSVEAVAEGSAKAVESFKKELAKGPSFARVTDVAEFEIPPSGRYSRFDVEY
ncbi:MAG: acylphosphatase [Blastocatellia bacterium AA13]|nr:MAG: acylphosphatase [Blastocatellia bacterium AA13]